MLACVGHEIRLYSFTATLLTVAHCDESYGGVNCAAFSLCGERVVAGCENGTVLFYTYSNDTLTLLGATKTHEKAVCSVMIRQDRIECVSGAKDGTARVWDTDTGDELAVLKCSIADLPGMKPLKQRASKRPMPILVRGCAYGIDGSIYTVASAKRGRAFLTRWVLQGKQYVEVARVACSESPISAISISEDRYTLALGGVDGTVTLFDVETLKPLRSFFEVHDLPVTCIAARPAYVGSELEIVNVISSSADNKMAFLTMRREKMGWTAIIVILVLPILFGILAKYFFEECGDEFTTMSFDKCTECMMNSLVAPGTRPGIMIPPY